MKLNKMALLAVGMVFQLASASAFCSLNDGAGNWSGEGSNYDDQGHVVATYQVDLTNTALDANTLETSGKVTLSDGSTQSFWQLMRIADNGAFSIESESGKGGGRCFSEELCEAYVAKTDKKGTAVSIVFDSTDSMRILGTDLDGRKVLAFTSEKLTRKQ